MVPNYVVVASPFLLALKEAWGTDFTLVEPGATGGGLSPAVAASAEVLVSDGGTLDSALVASLPRLKLVACFSTGYAGIDADDLRRRGIALTTAAGINAHDVADHAIALLLAWWHDIPQADRRVREGRWRQGLAPRPSLRGRRLGIVGLGRIGMQIARRAQALELSVRWWGPHLKPDAPYARAASLAELAHDSDILVVACRATQANAGIIDSTVLANLGKEGLLINVSRGFLVNETDLLQALKAGVIAGAALDVLASEPPDPQLWAALPNVLITPHMAGFTREAGAAMFGQLRENIRRHFAGLPLLTPISGSS